MKNIKDKSNIQFLKHDSTFVKEYYKSAIFARGIEREKKSGSHKFKLLKDYYEHELDISCRYM